MFCGLSLKRNMIAPPDKGVGGLEESRNDKLKLKN